MLNKIKNSFKITEKPPDQIGPLKLAYLGDSVYEMIIRTTLMDTGERSVKKMNKDAHELVNATAQAEVARILVPLLNDEEKSVFKRGRNAKSNSVSKHSNIQDYRVATGLEAVFGYWYLTDQMERALSLFYFACMELKLEEVTRLKEKEAASKKTSKKSQ